MDISIKMGPLSVMLAIPVNRDFPWQFEDSMVRSICALKDLNIPFTHQLLVGGSIIQSVRSELAATFLRTELDRILWIDSDMAWEPDALIRLLAMSNKLPVVGAAYPIKKDPHREFMLNLDDIRVEANEMGCVPVKGLGMGFVCVWREVIEKLAAKAPKITNKEGHAVPMIFRCDVQGDQFVGEDINFFNDCRAEGYEVWCDPQITLGHVGGKEYRGKLMDALQKI